MLAAPAYHWGAFAIAMATIFASLTVTRQPSPQSRAMWVVIAAVVGVGFFGGALSTLGYLGCAVAALGVGAWALFDRRFEAARWRARSVDPIVLSSPFRDEWWVAAGGAEPRHNHHQVVSDQYFAYDFLREDGPSWDQEILAPCDGEIAWTEDRHEDAAPDERRRDSKNPAGNYVSIKTGRGFVILAHLKKGSIPILPGVRGAAGEVIGRCGNSGNTTRAHLHIHAQDRPQMAVGIAQGVPIAFRDKDGQAWVLDYRDTLLPDGAAGSYRGQPEE